MLYNSRFISTIEQNESAIYIYIYTHILSLLDSLPIQVTIVHEVSFLENSVVASQLNKLSFHSSSREGQCYRCSTIVQLLSFHILAR